MSILKLWYAFTGYLVVSVRGVSTEKFINLAIRQGIPLWDIVQGTGEAVLKVDMDSFFELRHLAKKTGCRLHIQQKVGFPFFYSKLRRRRGMVVGLSIFILTLYILSSFILFISVEGADTLGEQRIRELASELGVRRGMLKTQLDKERLVNEMIILEQDIAWLSLEIKGTRLLIEVVEKINPPDEMNMPADIVAAKDGLIQDVLVIMGEPRVKPGDTVTRGQLLIEGVLVPRTTPAGPDEELEALPAVPVHARGEVWARVWYEGYGEAALQETIRTRSGRSHKNWSLVIDGQEILRLGRSLIPYRNYELETIKRSLPKRIIRVPVEIITEYAHELQLEQRKLTAEQASELAAERAMTLTNLQLPIGASVDTSYVVEVDTGKPGLVGVRYIVETIENIAREMNTSEEIG